MPDAARVLDAIEQFIFAKRHQLVEYRTTLQDRTDEPAMYARAATGGRIDQLDQITGAIADIARETGLRRPTYNEVMAAEHGHEITRR